MVGKVIECMGSIHTLKINQMNELKLNGLIKLPKDLTITPHGIKSLPFVLAEYKIIGLGKERVILQRGKKEHIKYVDTVNQLLVSIQELPAQKKIAKLN